ncbi:hypothetical protein ACRRTK_002600 [Alexandromys fortis]
MAFYFVISAFRDCLSLPISHPKEELHTLEVTGQETVAQIKAHVTSLEGIAPEDQVLLLAGSPLEDEATLGQCGVEALTTLEVAGRVLGGRAKRQMQYNRRFVNVVPTFGKKKGPNANS